MVITSILAQKVCCRFENPFLAIMLPKTGEEMAYALRTIGVFPADGLLAHASVSLLRK
jgi:hypothetical protein